MREASLLVSQQDRLLNLRLNEEVDQDMFAGKHTELEGSPRFAQAATRCPGPFTRRNGRAGYQGV